MEKGQRGAALVELLVAGIVLAFAVSALVGAMLGTSRASHRSKGRETAALYTTMLLEELKNYVTADASPREGAPGDPPGSWKLKGDPCGCWALMEGAHDASALLPSEFRDKAKARLTYTVNVETVGAEGDEVRTVEARLDWEEPQ
jgi:Tfp pilus assembly protein PilV